VTDDRRGVALIAVSIAVAAWGLGPLLVRAVDASLPTIVLYRLVLAQPLMIGAAYLTGGRLSFAMLRRAAVTAVCFATSLILSFASFRETSIANATLIPALLPVLVLIVSPFLFGERRHRRELVCAAVALGGVILVVLSASHKGASLHGDLLAVGNLVLFTGYFLLSKRARNENVHSWSFIAAVFLLSAIICAPWALATSHDLGAVHGEDWLYLITLALVPGLVGHGLMTWSHHFLDASVTSTMSLASPVISAAGAWLVYSQSLRAVQIVGAGAVLVSVAALLRGQRSDRDRIATEAVLAGDLDLLSS
jgi:drug/metabolite transporter (DMT)-like permease